MNATALDNGAAPDFPRVEVPVTARGLSIPRLRVTPAAGPAYEVQALNPDLLLYEDTAAKHRWRGPADAPFRWLTFLAWAASRRTGRIDPSVTWEVFAATTEQIENVAAADAEADRALPTGPGPGPG